MNVPSISGVTPPARAAAGTPATRSGHCECCATPYPGAPIIWDRVVTGWVLPTHRSAGTRHATLEQGTPVLF